MRDSRPTVHYTLVSAAENPALAHARGKLGGAERYHRPIASPPRWSHLALAMPMNMTSTTAEDRLAKLGIRLPDAPSPFGAYVPAIQTGNLLFLSGMLATVGHTPAMVGVVGKDLDASAGQEAAHAAALNVLALTRKQLGSLNRVTQFVRLSVFVAATAEFTEHAKVADGASEFLRAVFGENTVPARVVVGVSSLPLGSPVELEVILEVK